jgi:tetratricopeptide (TPR) repeat protein
MSGAGPITDRMAGIGHQLPSLLSSVGKLVVPAQLSPIAIARDTAAWPGVVGLVLLLGLARAVPAARRPMLGLAAAAMVLPLLPPLLISDKLLLENRLYLPAVGLALFIAELGRAVADRRAFAVAAAVAAIFGVLSWRYQRAFADAGAFTQAAVAGSPHGSLAHLQRGIWLQRRQRDLDAAAREYRAAIAADNTEPMAHNNLGVVLMNQRRWGEAEEELRQELALHPDTAVAHYNLGLVLRDRGRPDEAVRAWEEALRLDPDHIDALGELMVHAERTGDPMKARQYRDELTRHGAKFLSPGP